MTTQRYLSTVFFFSFLVFLLVSHTQVRAQGDLLIYPKRVVFDGTKRSQDLNLVNNGTDTARYVISVVQIRMKEDGSFENIQEPDPGQNFSDKNFRFFPRTIVLGPKEAQKVKLQLLGFSQLLPGEYRSHLYFRAQAEERQKDQEKHRKDSAALSIRITPVYGISIPVLIRAGESTTEISLSEVSFHWEKDSLPLLQMNIDRTGNMSVYGNITVDYLSPEGKEIRVAQVTGVAVYTPNSTRRVRLALDKNAGADFHRGSLHVVFTDISGKTEKVAQRQIFLP
jgi:P pilus assembly chaperone PapD